jgi:hypothetical protein
LPRCKRRFTIRKKKNSPRHGSRFKDINLLQTFWSKFGLGVIDQYFITNTITILIVAYAAFKVGAPERWCAAAIGVEWLVDLVLHFTIGPRSFQEFNLSRLLLDLMKVVVFLPVALRANRIYTSGIAAAGVITVIGNVPSLVEKEGWNQAYWAMTNTPNYVMLVLLLAGTVAHRRRLARVGNYNCWSPRLNAALQPG